MISNDSGKLESSGVLPNGDVLQLGDALLRRLLFHPEAISRNQNFATFNEPEFRTIRERARHLRSVLTLLSTTPLKQVQLIRTKGGWEIRVQLPEQSAERMVMLSEAEIALLATHPTATALRGR
ncbi:MAG: hypothetical protein ACI81R_002215 [Bradymonadia bacterium]|jgi:hypothetical protein